MKKFLEISALLNFRSSHTHKENRTLLQIFDIYNGDCFEIDSLEEVVVSDFLLHLTFAYKS